MERGGKLLKSLRTLRTLRTLIIFIEFREQSLLCTALLSKLCLEFGKSIVVGQGVGSSLILNLGSLFLRLARGSSLALSALLILKYAAMAENDTASHLIELKHLEGKLLVELSLGLVLLNKVFRSGEALDAVLQLDYVTLVVLLDNGTLVDGANGEDGLEYIPGILLGLLVTKAEAAALLVNLQHYYLDVSTDLGNLGRMLNLLGPGEVRDVDEAVNTLLQLYKHAEVGKVANPCSMLAAHGIALLDILPRIVLKLLDAKRHLALCAIEVEHYSLHLVTYLEEVLSRAEVSAPAHLADVDETFNAGSNLNECAVVGHHYNLTLNLVANLYIGVKSLPRMRGELLQTEGYALLLLVEVNDYHVELLAKLHDIVGISHAAP